MSNTIYMQNAGLRSWVGKQASGGGGNTGVPLGPFLTWAELPISAEDGAFANVLSLGPSNSGGIASWSNSDSSWVLFFGLFASTADMNAFPHLIGEGATATISATGDKNSSRIRYVYDGTSWIRTPDGTGYIWPDVATTLLLPTVAVAGDRCTVTATGFVYQYNGTIWEIVYGTVPDVASLPTSDINGDALLGVGTDGVHERTWYGRHAGAWIRTPEARGYAWVISGLRDFNPTGSLGALAEGDYGFFGSNLYRYAAAVPIAAGGTTPMWLPPVVYAGTLSLRGIIVGTEAIPALPGSIGGWSLVTATGHTISQASDYMQIVSTTGANTTAYATSAFTIRSGIRTYTQVELATTYTGTVGAASRFIGSEGNGVPAWWHRVDAGGGYGGINAPYFTNSTLALQGSSLAIRQGGIALPTVASGNYAWLDFVDSGRDIAVDATRNGVDYARSQRSSSSPGPGTPGAGVTLLVTNSAAAAGGTMTTRIRNMRTLTW